MFRQMAITKYLYSDTSLNTLLLISQRPKLTHRNNMDSRDTNSRGDNFLDFLKATRMRILNGRVFGDTLGNFRPKKINTLFPVTSSQKSRPETRDYFFFTDKFFFFDQSKLTGFTPFSL